MKKAKFCLIFFSLILFFALPGFASVDTELQLNCNIAYSEFPTKEFQAYSTLYPYFVCGPIKASYVFDNLNLADFWNFSVGLKIIPWPFQIMLASTSVFFTVCVFDNGGLLEIGNDFDVGISMLFENYYDTSSGRKKLDCNATLALCYELSLLYRNPSLMHFYTGVGLSVGGVKIYDSFFVVYDVSAIFGFRIPTKK